MSTLDKPRFLGTGPAAVRLWGERVALLATALAGWWLATTTAPFTDAQRVVAWLALLLLLIYLLRAGLVRLGGPVLLYDLVRSARRSRTYFARVAFLLLLWLFLWATVGSRPSATVHSTEAAHLAESFFLTYVGVQFVLAVFLTPAYVGSAITEEKEGKTLEFILATDLDAREIVLGKFVSRVGNLVLLLLSGLPVLSFAQFLGGVSPELVFIAFIGTACTILGIAGLAMFTSTFARRSRDAIMQTYLIMVAYSGLCMIGSVLIEMKYVPDMPLFGSWLGLSTHDVIHAFQAGNPTYALSKLNNWGFGPGISPLIVLRDYAIFHGILTCATLTYSMLRLRPVALAAGGAVGIKKALMPRRWRTAGVGRPIGDHPMIWKEMYHDNGPRLRGGAWLVGALLVLLSFAPVFFMLFEADGRRHLAEGFNIYARSVGTTVAMIALIAMAVRGSMVVRIEKDRDTLDALLTSPLTNAEIMSAKWLGCMWSARWPGLWLGLVYSISVLFGGVSILVLVPLLAVCLIYAGVLAAVGMWFSIICTSAVKANVSAIFTAIAMMVGHWLIWMCCIPLGGGGGEGLKVFVKLQTGITPPAVLGILAMQDSELFNQHAIFEEGLHFFMFFGTVCWMVVGLVVYATACDRFRMQFGRDDVRYPETRDPLLVRDKPDRIVYLEEEQDRTETP